MTLRRRERALLWSAGFGAACSLVVTIVLVGLWVRSHQTPQAWTRTQWELSATTDEWWTTTIDLSHGTAAAVFTHDTAPAFVGQVMGAGGAIAPDRVTPSGVLWGDALSYRTRPVLSDAPPILSALGIRWETRRATPGSSAMFPADRWSLGVKLWLPTTVGAAATILLAALAYRAGRPFRRARRGLCPGCGYDVRHAPGRCPECGGQVATVAR